MKKLTHSLSTFFLTIFCTFSVYAKFELPTELKDCTSIKSATTLGTLLVPLVVGVVIIIIAVMNLSLIAEAIGDFKKTKDIKPLLNSLLGVVITMVVAALIAGYITSFSTQYFDKTC